MQVLSKWKEEKTLSGDEKKEYLAYKEAYKDDWNSDWSDFYRYGIASLKIIILWIAKQTHHLLRPSLVRFPQQLQCL